MSSIRKKKEQRDAFDGTQTSYPPQWNTSSGKKREHPSPSSTTAPIIKRSRTSGVSSQRLMDSFYQSMRDNITNKVKPIIGKDKKLIELKKTMSEVKRLPPGILNNAEKICNCNQGELSNYLEHHTLKRNFVHWQDYVKENFDNIVLSFSSEPSSSSGKTLQQPSQAESSSLIPSLRRELSAMDVVSEVSSISGAPTEMSDISIEKEEESMEYRTCTVSFKSILRKDVNPQLAEAFLRKVNAALYNVSDYLMDIQLVVFTLMLSMKSSQFVVAQNGDVEYNKCQGFPIDSILPPDFRMKSDTKFSAPPLSSDAVKSESFCKNLKQLFQSQHIDYLHVTLFGKRGSKSTNSIFHALAESNHPLISSLSQETPRPANELMKVALNLYKVNLKNMWSGNKLFSRILNKVIEILLRIHLAPKREKKYQDYIESKSKEDHEKDDISKPSRNSFHNVIRSEKHKLKKYQRKAQGKGEDNKWFVLAEKSQQRINNMHQSFRRSDRDKPLQEEFGSASNDNIVPIEEIIPFNEVLEEEEMEEAESDDRDVTRRRILTLKAVIKDLMFNHYGETITDNHFKEEVPDITPSETVVCLMLSNTLLPYIPNKENYGHIGFQLPFLLLANDVLQSVGYSKFVMDLCPTSSHASLSALRLDAPSIYALCSQKNEGDQMTIFDFQGYVIDSAVKARTYKDAIFNSFFDIRAISNACKSYKLTFAHNVIISPGLKSARILGNRPIKDQATNTNTNANLIDIDWDTVKDLQSRSNQELKSDIADIGQEIQNVSALLKEHIRQFRRDDFSTRIKDLKIQWKNDHSKYQEIQKLKADRFNAFSALQATKQQLADLRSQQYYLRKAIQYRNKNIPSIARTEEIHNEESLGDLIFSGTDNGLKVMTETVAIDINKYKYCLNLHNKYSPLASDNDNNDLDAASDVFQPLPESYKMYAEDIDFGSGQFRKRKLMEKDKQSTEGRQVKMIETKLSKSSVYLSKNVDEIQSRLVNRKEDIKTLRAFYHSKKMVNLTRSTECNDKRFRSGAASKERSFCVGRRPQTSLIMFIGDRGTGVGSRLNGHLKYGGKWKPKLHAVSSAIHFTNEHKTSQTCMFCFGPLTHPKRTSKDKSAKKTVNGAFWCLNPRCISVRSHRPIQSRDKTSASAIAVSGLSNLIFNEPLPVFNPKPSQSYTGIFTKTNAFCSRNEHGDGSGAASAEA